MIKNGDDTNVLGTITTFASSATRLKERKEKGKRGRGKERVFFPKYQVNKINQNYNNAVYKWVKSDEFLRGVTRGGLTPILPHSPPPPRQPTSVTPLAVYDIS